MLTLVLAALMLVVGGSIYLLFRSRQILLYVIADKLGAGDAVESLREALGGVRPPYFATYCLPDALWVSSYILVVDWAMQGRKPSDKLLVASIIPALGLLSETAQAFGLCPGTYDAWDLAAYAAPAALYTVYITTKQICSSQANS